MHRPFSDKFCVLVSWSVVGGCCTVDPPVSWVPCEGTTVGRPPPEEQELVVIELGVAVTCGVYSTSMWSPLVLVAVASWVPGERQTIIEPHQTHGVKHQKIKNSC